MWHLKANHCSVSLAPRGISQPASRFGAGEQPSTAVVHCNTQALQWVVTCQFTPGHRSGLASLNHSASAVLYHICHHSGCSLTLFGPLTQPVSSSHTHSSAPAKIWSESSDGSQCSGQQHNRISPVRKACDFIMIKTIIFFLKQGMLTLKQNRWFQKGTHQFLLKLQTASACRFSKKQLLESHSQVFTLLCPKKTPNYSCLWIAAIKLKMNLHACKQNAWKRQNRSV